MCIRDRIISAAALAFLILYNLTNLNISERYREISTLKVLGFYDKEVLSYVYRENFILTFIGIILGCFLGTALHYYIITTVEVDAVMFGRTINFISYVWSVILEMCIRDRDRKMTILLTPFMSCSAKLPIYAMITAAFFPENGAVVMICLYVLGILVGIGSGLLFKHTLFKGNPVPFVMEQMCIRDRLFYHLQHVGREKHGVALLAMLLQKHLQGMRGLRVQPDKGLVQHQQLGLVNQGGDDRQLLLHAVGIGTDGVAKPGGDLHAGGKFVNQLLAPVCADPVNIRHKDVYKRQGLTFQRDSVQVFIDGHLVDEADYSIVTTGLSDGLTFEIRIDNLQALTAAAGAQAGTNLSLIQI